MITVRITRLDEHSDEIVERYRAGESMEVLGSAFDVSPATIRNRLLEWGVETRNRGEPYQWLDEEVPDIIHRSVVGRDSLQTIADHFGTTTSPIKKRLREAGVELRPWTLEFSNRQRSVIEGELLGDGCIYQRLPGSCHFKLEATTRGHAEYLQGVLPDGFFPPKHPYTIDRTTEFGNGPTTRWIVYSRTQDVLSELYESWYELREEENRKRVPSDYNLDETALLHWYWGDGSITHRPDGTPRVHFSTHGFSERSICRLQGELERFGDENYTVRSQHVDSGSGLAIRLSDPASERFTESFASENVIEEYDYKFERSGSSG